MVCLGKAVIIMNKMRAVILLAAFLYGFLGIAGESVQPAIATLVKPEIFKRALKDREIMSNASLGDDGRYKFYAMMFVRAGLPLTRRILTDYGLYAKMIKYVDYARYDADKQILTIEGGIWKFRLSSSIRFEEKGSGWIGYRIVAGHFKDLSGDIYFESHGEGGTAVYFCGGLSGTEWPPRLIIERGAEIVFGFTGGRMRSYIESQKEHSRKEKNEYGSEIPHPRSRIQQDQNR